ncbi:MAG TPA: HipA domain-containing protein [Solirubrobacterales bacterium]|nr:HipA domain-containing protein [Solirubrobacterales bacterium]
MSLDVYLHGKRIGGLFPAGEHTYSFAYAPETVEEVGAGKVLLSNSLPVRSEPFGPDASRAYVEGLLPQGRRRHAIAHELGLDPADGYRLIAEMGRDCLGAVTFLAEGEIGEPCQVSGPAWLSELELEEVVQAPPGAFFDRSRPQRMRFALPGERHKLALVRDEESDRWAWPEPGVPSTHIVKPEAPERPGLVPNEHACTLAYRELGLPVAHTSVETIAGQPCLVSKRFDRWGEGPRAERLHQESFAQALGVTPDCAERRLSTGTPTLGEASGLLRAIGEEKAVETLMKVTFCDLLIGCTELRGANTGLLFGNDGPMLAPFYDIASTEIYGEIRPRPIVIGDDVPPAPLLIDLRHTIELCELEFQPAIIESVKLMGAVCTALDVVAADAWEEGWFRPAIDEAVQIATARALGFREESVYLRPPGA